MKTPDQVVDRVHQEVLLALKVSEDEIEATAAAPDFYDRVRSRIEARGAGERRKWIRAMPGFGSGFFNIRSLRFTLTAAAVLLVLSVSAVVLLPKLSRGRDDIAESASSKNDPPSPRVADSGKPAAPPYEHNVAAVPASTERARRTVRRRIDRRPEVATDYLPLTFTADAPESGHVVRVKVPRSALIAFGLPMNVNRAEEMVKADVFIGDDGLARAIRFVQ